MVVKRLLRVMFSALALCAACVAGPAVAGEACRSCKASSGPWLFQQRASGHYWRPDLRRTRLRALRRSPGQEVELAFMDCKAANTLLRSGTLKAQLWLFDCCYVMPRLNFQRTGLDGIRIYSSGPGPGLPRVMASIEPRPSLLCQRGRVGPRMHLVAEFPGERIEIQLEGGVDPGFGERYSVRRLRHAGPLTFARTGGALQAPGLDSPEGRRLQGLLGSASFIRPDRRESIEVAVGYTVEACSPCTSDAELFTLKSLAEFGALWWQLALEANGIYKAVSITGLVATGIREMDYADAFGQVDSRRVLRAVRWNRPLNRLRDETHADFATAFVGTTSIKSLAYLWKPLTVWKLGAVYAYSILRLDFAVEGMAHECGHNIGCGHLYGNRAQTTYAHAWCLLASPPAERKKRLSCTVMVGSDVAERPDVGGVDIYRAYSTPGRTHSTLGGAIGRPKHDNERLLDRNIVWASNWGRVFSAFYP